MGLPSINSSVFISIYSNVVVGYIFQLFVVIIDCTFSQISKYQVWFFSFRLRSTDGINTQQIKPYMNLLVGS